MALGLLDYQLDYRGFRIGADTPYEVVSHEGLLGFEVRSADEDLPRGDGAVRGRDLVAARQCGIDVEVVGSEAEVESLLAALRDAFDPSETLDSDLVFKLPGQVEQLIRARPTQLRDRRDWKGLLLRTQPITMRAADPRIYSSDVRQLIVPIYSAAGGGIDYPVGDYPIDWTASASGEVVATNAGKARAYPLIRWYGPVTGTATGVKLTNLTNGEVIDIQTTVSAGQILTADIEAYVTGAARRVIALSGASRYGSWQFPHTAWSLSPGDNVVRFELTGTSVNVQALLTWRDTWRA